MKRLLWLLPVVLVVLMARSQIRPVDGFGGSGTGGGTTNINYSSNGIFNIAITNVKVSGTATQLNLVAGNNLTILGTNASDKVSIGILVKSNLDFYVSGSRLTLGSDENSGIFGLSNANTGAYSWYLGDPSQNTLFVTDTLAASNVTLYTLANPTTRPVRVQSDLFMASTNRLMFSNGTAFVMSPTNDAVYFFNTNGSAATLLWSDGSTGGAGFQSGGGALLNAVTSYSNTVNLATLVARAIKLTNGAVNGYVLTSDASGLASWAAGSSSSAGTNIGIGQVIYLDAAFGDDSTASRTNLLRPYLTASNATAAMLSGDTLVVRGGTYLVNPKAAAAASFAGGQNTSGGLAITNRTNIRITGEPGSIWQMSGWYSNSSTYSQPMLNLTRCTNVLIDGLTMRGIKTSAQVIQDYAVLLTDCDNVTFQSCKIQYWNNQGITDLSQTSINRNLFCYDTEFRDTGGTNTINLGTDGTAWSAIATNIIMRNNRFFYNLRDFEECCNGDARGLIYEGNYSIGCYGSVLLLIATNNSEMKIINNIQIGYATNEQAGGVSWLTLRAASNLVVQGNQIQGYGGKGVTYDTLAGARFVDAQFLDNTFHDFTDLPFFLHVPVGNSATFERVSLLRNKFKNTSTVTVSLNANNARIEDNTFADCNTGLNAGGIIGLGWPTAGVSTNATNITIIGNKFYAGQSSIASTAIVIYATCYSNAIWGNEISRIYQGQVHDLGVGTLKAPVNLINQGELLMNDTNRRMAGVIIGSGLAFDPSTRTLTGTSGSSSQYVAFAIGGLTLTNNVDLAVSNTVNFGSRLKPAGTNYVMGLQLPTGAGRNRNAKSDDNGFLSWGTPNSGGNGNGSGVFPPVGGIQFAMTNTADNTMMLESTNDFRYLQAINEMQITNQVSTSNTVIGAGYIRARLLEVSNLNVATLVVTNGIPAAGSQFNVQYNFGNVLAASANINIIPSAYKITVANPGTSGEIDIQGEGFITQANGGVGLAFGTLADTNILINPKGAVIIKPTTGIGTNLFQISTTNNLPSLTVSSNGALSIGVDSGAAGMLAFGTNSGAISNVAAIKWNIWTNYVPTVSNFVFSFNTNYVELKNQTNLVFTNIVEEATGIAGNLAVHVHNTTGVTMGLVWPAYGAQHGYYLQTNVNNPIITTTTLTTGKHGIASLSCFGTNIFATWTEWP